MESSQTTVARRHPEDFGSSLQRLADSVESTMAAVYDLDVAVLNTQPSPSRQEFLLLRQTLRDHWTGLQAFLHSCSVVVDDFYILSKTAGVEPEQERAAFLKEIIEESVAKLQNSCKALVARNAGISLGFQNASSQFISKRSSRNVAGPRRSLSARVRGLTPHANQFVQFSLNSAYPDVSSSATATQQSLIDTHIILNEISQFWDSLEARFQASSDDQHTESQLLMLEDKSTEYSTVWEANGEDIRHTLASLSRSIDLLSIEATAPLSHEEHLDRGVSWNAILKLFKSSRLRVSPFHNSSDTSYSASISSTYTSRSNPSIPLISHRLTSAGCTISSVSPASTAGASEQTVSFSAWISTPSHLPLLAIPSSPPHGWPSGSYASSATSSPNTYSCDDDGLPPRPPSGISVPQATSMPEAQVVARSNISDKDLPSSGDEQASHSTSSSKPHLRKRAHTIMVSFFIKFKQHLPSRGKGIESLRLRIFR
ncbi:unnamed protein product [Cyclocybe aegerita]|uniref:Uncharacterized protein n=1 Tax=Cyclocybe aegerita TaxID=1973307 RepID=A0A8S0XS59_CYCAE|nr:unnamed protein product [Cyclocybe aegerita]